MSLEISLISDIVNSGDNGNNSVGSTLLYDYWFIMYLIHFTLRHNGMRAKEGSEQRRQRRRTEEVIGAGSGIQTQKTFLLSSRFPARRPGVERGSPLAASARRRCREQRS